MACKPVQINGTCFLGIDAARTAHQLRADFADLGVTLHTWGSAQVERLLNEFQAIDAGLETHISGILDFINEPSEVTKLASSEPVKTYLKAEQSVLGLTPLRSGYHRAW